MNKVQRKVNTIEKWVKKLVIIQLVFLILSQILMDQRNITPYLNKAIKYEGVFHFNETSTIETIDLFE